MNSFAKVNDGAFTFSMQQLIRDVPTVTGLQRFATSVATSVDYLLGGDVQILQKTKAIVVQNASGVGKTVGSIAVCKRLSELSKNELFVPLYLGFNSNFSLNKPEIALLQDKSIGSYDRVASVVGRRLLLQLQALMRECGLSSDPNTALESVLRPDGGWQPRTPLPMDMKMFDSAKRFPDFFSIEEECAALIKQLSEYCGGKGLVVLLIMDEGQFLDECIKPAGDDSGGARCALRFGRNVQLRVSKYAAAGSTKMCALPIMTGLNPVTSLSQVTTGYNEVFDGALHNKEEFVEVVKATDVKKEFTDREYKMFAAVFYPVARDAELYFKKNKQINPTQDVEQEEDADEQKKVEKLPRGKVPKELAPLMLMAGGVKMELDDALWHTAIPAEFNEDNDTFLPVPSCYRITSYIHACSWIYNGIPKWVPIHGLGNELRSALNLSDDGFEATCGRVLTLILTLANTPFPKSEAKWQSWNLTYSFPVISSCFRGAQSKLRNEHPWFDIPCDLTEIQEPVELRHAKQVLLPSSSKVGKGGKTEEAFSLKKDGTPAHSLCSSVKDALNALENKGECYVLRCGGSAPVDFIFVTLLTDRVLTNANNLKSSQKRYCEVAIRLADAKHGDPDQPSTLGRTEVGEMIVKFQLVANYLHAVLEAECGMQVVEEKSAIFTNRKPTKPMMEAQLTISTTWTKKGNLHPLYILSPETFNFPPLTDFLYAWRPSVQQ